MLTQHGPVCDVGGEYILLEWIQEFGVGIGKILHCCETHLPVLQEAKEKRDWRVLPDGPLRRTYEITNGLLGSVAPQ